MVDIDKYLTRYNLLHEPQYTRFKDAFSEFYLAQKDRYKTSIKEIYSTRIFPSRVKANGEHYVIVDYHFANMFSYYSTFYLCFSNQLPFELDKERVKLLIKNLIILSQASLQEDIPGLALSFAEEYIRNGGIFKKYDSLLNLENKNHILNQVEIFANMFTIYHETGHIRYNELEKAENGYWNFMNYLEWWCSCTDTTFSKNPIELKRVFEKNEKSTLEELYCDFHAVVGIIDDVKRVCNNNLSDYEMARLTINSIMLAVEFQALLVQNRIQWKRMYYHYNNMYEKEKRMQLAIRREFDHYQIRFSLLLLMATHSVGQEFKLDKWIDLYKGANVFDETSIELLNDFSERIMERTRWNELHYSEQEMSKMRNLLLRWV